MKTYAAKLYLAFIFGSAIFAPLFIYHLSVKNTAFTKTQVDQERIQAAEGQNVPKKLDSFTAGKAFREKKDSFDSMETRVGRGKNYLLTQVKNRLNQLEPFRTRVNNITTLSDSERKSLVAELNAEIALFEALKLEINKSATKEDIQDVADKIKAEWIKSRLSVARAEKEIVAAKENQLISDADAASLAIQKRIGVLKAEGKNTKAHEKLLSAYSKKIASAKQDMEVAQDKIVASAGASTEDVKAKQTREKDYLLMSAHDSLSEAYMLLKDEARREFSQRFK
jgi:hypothetical protein